MQGEKKRLKKNPLHIGLRKNASQININIKGIKAIDAIATANSFTNVFLFRTFLRPHNVSRRRKLPRPKGAYGVLAQRQPARGARYREVQHVTHRERVWRTRQRRHGPDSKRGAGDGSLQGTPAPASFPR